LSIHLAMLAYATEKLGSLIACQTHTDRHRHTGNDTHRQTDRQTDRHTDR